MNSVFFTFLDRDTAATNGKECNRFYMASDADLKSFMMCGESRYPDTLANHGMAMHYHRLLHGIGSANNVSHHTSITDTTYKSSKFIGIQDFGALPAAADHSGLNTYNSQLTINFEGMGTSGSIPVACYVTSFFDVVMEISSAGVTVST